MTLTDANLADILATLNDTERETLGHRRWWRGPDARRPKHQDAVRPLRLAGLITGDDDAIDLTPRGVRVSGHIGS